MKVTKITTPSIFEAGIPKRLVFGLDRVGNIPTCQIVGWLSYCHVRFCSKARVACRGNKDEKEHGDVNRMPGADGHVGVRV